MCRFLVLIKNQSYKGIKCRHFHVLGLNGAHPFSLFSTQNEKKSRVPTFYILQMTDPQFPQRASFRDNNGKFHIVWQLENLSLDTVLPIPASSLTHNIL